MKQLFWCLFCKQRVKRFLLQPNILHQEKAKPMVSFLGYAWKLDNAIPCCLPRKRQEWLESHQPGVSAILVFFPKCVSSRTLCLSAVLCLGTAPSAAVYLKDIPATGHFCPTLSLLTKISNWHALRLRKLETKMQPFLPGPLWKSGNIWKHFS